MKVGVRTEWQVGGRSAGIPTETPSPLPHPQLTRPSWRSAVKTLTLLSTVPVEALRLPLSFAPDPLVKPYFPRQVNSLLKVSKAQSATPCKTLPDGIVGDIWGTKELQPYFESGAKSAGGEQAHGASVVHGDYKLDNLVSTGEAGTQPVIGKKDDHGVLLMPLPILTPMAARPPAPARPDPAQIFHPTENRVIGILDWELCTLGSPLADLGNLLLAWSIPPVTPAQLAALAAEGGGGNLAKGIRGVPSSTTGIPQAHELESWWAQGMNSGNLFHSIASGGAQAREPWVWPIAHMEWVRAWMLFRLAIIAQGISARAALGQASSASARPTRAPFDFFGKAAYEVMKNDDDRAAGAKL